MHSSFTAFMSGLIDYAGLFPPAKLPLKQAFKNYLRYQNEADAWILAKFICPVKMLKDLLIYKKDLQDNIPDISLTVIPSAVETSDGYLETFFEEIQEIKLFLQKMEQNIRIEALEIRIFPALLTIDSSPALHLFLNEIYKRLISAGILNVTLFFELNQSGRWADRIKHFAEEIVLFNQNMIENEKSVQYSSAGLKLRCGGEKPENVPAPEEVAHSIYTCAIKGIPFKATAGLHHPLRHYDTALRTKVHGFLNIFGSALLAFHHQLNSSEIQSIILEEDPTQFIFNGDLFQYKQWHIHTDQIQTLRKELVISFGSCSFDDPREDLVELGLLNKNLND